MCVSVFAWVREREREREGDCNQGQITGMSQEKPPRAVTEKLTKCFLIHPVGYPNSRLVILPRSCLCSPSGPLWRRHPVRKETTPTATQQKVSSIPLSHTTQDSRACETAVHIACGYSIPSSNLPRDHSWCHFLPMSLLSLSNLVTAEIKKKKMKMSQKNQQNEL